MVCLAFAAGLAPAVYGFAPDTRYEYAVKANFDGFLPVLGGNQGVVDVAMDVLVVGRQGTDGNLRASSEIVGFDLAFNGAKLPLNVQNVSEFFPKTTVDLTPSGRILSTDAPDRPLPVRLPGLDVKRFPDITYVPIELPAGALATGDSWSFTRDFGGEPLLYECNVMLLTDGTAKIAVRVRQEYTLLENDGYEVVKDRESAAREVRTTLTGVGTVTFDLSAGVARSALMTNTALGTETDLATGVTTERKLVTRFEVRLKDPGLGSAARVSGRAQAERGSAWERLARTARTAWFWLQLASVFGLGRLPREFEAWVAPLRPQIARVMPWLLSR